MNVYVRAVGSAALQGLATGLFAAAAALPRSQRRTARGVTVAGLSVVASLGRWTIDRDREERADQAADEPAVDEPAVDEPAVDEPAVDEPAVGEPAADEPVRTELRLPTRRDLATLGAGLALTTVSLLVRRRLERRWLAALRAHGHPHPYRVLGVRMGLLGFAGALPARLSRAHISHR